MPDRVDVSSPDGSVRVIAGLDGAVGVQVRRLERHDDTSLARQVAAAARLALAALTVAERRRFDEFQAAPIPPVSPW